MSLRRQEIVLVTDTLGAGTAQTARPVNGVVIELRNDSAAWGGTADYTFTRAGEEGGGTVASLPNQAGPFSVYTGGSVFGLGPSAVSPGIAVDGYLTMTVAQATVSTAGTVHVYSEDR